MITVFWWMAICISVLFFIVMLVIVACQWIIYFRIERTTLKQQKLAQADSHTRKKVEI
jgi:hypothetical protein